MQHTGETKAEQPADFKFEIATFFSSFLCQDK
jgi:hypothetical protein